MQHRPNSPHKILAVVALTVAAAVLTLPATALADSWGPDSSYYDGIKRVTGNGTITRLSTGSRSYVRACDNWADGWGVHAYTIFRSWRDAAHSGFLGTTVRETPTRQTTCISDTWSLRWTSFYGHWVEAGACAQVGWPVPDNCVPPAEESHTP